MLIVSVYFFVLSLSLCYITLCMDLLLTVVVRALSDMDLKHHNWSGTNTIQLTTRYSAIVLEPAVASNSEKDTRKTNDPFSDTGQSSAARSDLMTAI